MGRFIAVDRRRPDHGGACSGTARARNTVQNVSEVP